MTGSRHARSELASAKNALSMLQDIGKHCRVYAPDLRFHGDSDKPKWVGHTLSHALLAPMKCIMHIPKKRVTLFSFRLARCVPFMVLETLLGAQALTIKRVALKKACLILVSFRPSGTLYRTQL